MGDNGKCAPQGTVPCDPEDKAANEVPADPPAEGCDKVCPPAEQPAEPVGAEA